MTLRYASIDTLTALFAASIRWRNSKPSCSELTAKNGSPFTRIDRMHTATFSTI